MFVTNEKELRKECKPCGAREGNIIGERLLEMLAKTNDGVGLAANQVGINKRVCVVNVDRPIVLINPKIQLSTKKVFKNLVIERPRGKRPIINVNNFNDIYKISSLGNDLEKTAIKIVPEISNILDFFKKYDTCFSYGMSGSGATCYGIFYSRNKANDFKRAIIKANETKNYWIWSGGLLKKRDLILKV